jgi:hypothetical protein
MYHAFALCTIALALTGECFGDVAVIVTICEPSGEVYALGADIATFSDTVASNSKASASQSLIIEVNDDSTATALTVSYTATATPCSGTVVISSGVSPQHIYTITPGARGIEDNIIYLPPGASRRLRATTICVPPNAIYIIPDSPDQCVIDADTTFPFAGAEFTSSQIDLLLAGAAVVALLPAFISYRLIVRCRRGRKRV